MPITVEGPDGSTVEFPDGTSKQVMQQAMAEKFGGPKTPKAPAPTVRPKKGPSPLDKFLAPTNLKDTVLSARSGRPTAKTARERGYQKAKVVDETTRKKSLLPKLPGSDYMASERAAMGRSMFNLPDVIAAAVQAPFSDQTFSEIRDELGGADDYQTEKSTAGNIIGTVIGSVMGGSGAGAVIRGAGGRLAASGAPAAVRAVGRGAQALATTNRGQRAANLAKMTVAGGAGGGAQALAEGTDVGTGATIGAVAAPALIGLGKSAAFVARPVGDLLGLPSAGTILKRFTNSSVDDIEAAAQRYRDETGAEPTLYEILPLADRNRLAKELIGRTPEASARAANAVRQRVANVGPEMQRTAQVATADERARIIQQMSDDLDAARVAGGGQARQLPGPDPMAERAATSPIDLKGFQGAEAAARMASTEGSQVADDVQSLFPRSLQRNQETGEIEEVFSDPEVNAAITNAAGTLRLRRNPDDNAADIVGLTADDMTRVLKNLAAVQPGTPGKGAAMRAEQHIMDYMERTNPQAREAIDAMRDSYARRARMIEGMAEGGRTRTRASIPVQSSKDARAINNAYGTPEGGEGRFMGQANAVERGFDGTTRDVLNAADNIAESGQTQAALRQNLGDDPAETIRRAADAQMTSVRSLASLNRETSQTADSLGAEDLGLIILALNPASMPTTKLFALSRLTSLTRLPESRAREIVDMLFSQNPAITNRAISLLNRAGPEVQNALNSITKSLALGNLAGQAAGPMTEPGSPIPSAEAAPAPQETPVEEPGQEFGSYDEVLADWEANEDPELVSLIDAQFNQESGNQQFDEAGNPLQSSAGAIGIAQVMPGTAPEAAQLAGLPWDEEAYYTDPAYNKLLGIAYMKEMLRRFDGDVELALAAYNAGPGAVDAAGGIPSIAETENYVDSILARR